MGGGTEKMTTCHMPPFLLTQRQGSAATLRFATELVFRGISLCNHVLDIWFAGFAFRRSCSEHLPAVLLISFQYDRREAYVNAKSRPLYKLRKEPDVYEAILT